MPAILSNQHWVEQILDDVCSKVPSEKIILTFAGGAYDWRETSIGKSIGYQQAISTAEEKKQDHFRSYFGQLHFTYMDKDSLDHTIYFTDAATNFNVIRMADDWATGGVALWRMGLKTQDLWSFFQKNLSIDSLRKQGIDMRKINLCRFK
jgi:spore germination protein YaaH